MKSDQGLVLTYVGNHLYKFNTINDSTNEAGSVMIGGQFAAAYLAGVLSAQNPNFPLTNYPNGLGANYWTDGTAGANWTAKVYHFTVSELNEALGDGWILTRFVNNSNVFAKGITYTAKPEWSLYPVREITNYLHKALATGLRQYIGGLNTAATITAANRLAEGILNDAVARRLITSYSVAIKNHPSEVDAIKVEASFVTVKPINKIYLDITVS